MINGRSYQVSCFLKENILPLSVQALARGSIEACFLRTFEPLSCHTRRQNTACDDVQNRKVDKTEVAPWFGKCSDVTARLEIPMDFVSTCFPVIAGVPHPFTQLIQCSHLL